MKHSLLINVSCCWITVIVLISYATRLPERRELRLFDVNLILTNPMQISYFYLKSSEEEVYIAHAKDFGKGQEMWFRQIQLGNWSTRNVINFWKQFKDSLGCFRNYKFTEVSIIRVYCIFSIRPNFWVVTSFVVVLSKYPKAHYAFYLNYTTALNTKVPTTTKTVSLKNAIHQIFHNILNVLINNFKIIIWFFNFFVRGRISSHQMEKCTVKCWYILPIIFLMESIDALSLLAFSLLYGIRFCSVCFAQRARICGVTVLTFW